MCEGSLTCESVESALWLAHSGVRSVLFDRQISEIGWGTTLEAFQRLEGRSRFDVSSFRLIVSDTDAPGAHLHAQFMEHVTEVFQNLRVQGFFRRYYRGICEANRVVRHDFLRSIPVIGPACWYAIGRIVEEDDSYGM